MLKISPIFFYCILKVAYNLLKCLLNSPLMCVKTICLRASIPYPKRTMDFKFEYQTQRIRGEFQNNSISLVTNNLVFDW